MRILVTGAKGFIGRNLCSELNNIKYGRVKTYDIDNKDMEIYEYDLDSPSELLDQYCQKTDFIFHLAGVNRPVDSSEYMTGNYGFTSVLLDTLKKHNNKCPIMLSSSIQAELANDYGKSKKAGEELLIAYSKETDANVLIYRFPNIFGKWCKPNYNSVVATFCYNIANDLPIQINDRNTVINLNYIDDVVAELIAALQGNANKEGDFCRVSILYSKSVGEIADLIYSFKAMQENGVIPDMADLFVKKLHATYTSYMPLDKLKYPLFMNVDSRGSFSEFIRSTGMGQISVNITKPNIIKGNHWHHTKIEKFLVVSGKGIIRFKRYNSDEIVEYTVSGDKLEVLDIPAGCSHNIENIGDTDLVTIMWANEIFDSEHPETYHLEI